MIEADAQTLMRQAHLTAHDYLVNAQIDIDQIFGDGYAREHPELIAAYMRTAAQDLHTAITAKEIGEALRELATAITGLKDQ